MSMAEERHVPRIAAVRPVIERIDALPADQATAVRAAMHTIGVQRGEPIDLPTAPDGYSYMAQRPHLATAPLVIYRRSQPDEPGDWLVVSLMTPEEFWQQKQDELSNALRNPDVRREIATAAGTAATTVSTSPRNVHIALTGGAASTTDSDVPRSGEIKPSTPLSDPSAPEDSWLLPQQPHAGNAAKVRTMMPYRPVSTALAIAPTVSVIIPAMNEALSLPHVFATLPPWVDEIVVVDGNSTDDTVAVARALSPQPEVVLQPGRGKGDALLAGFAAATGEIIVTIDADGSTDGTEIAAFVGALVAGADFAKGSRFSSSGRSDDITAMRRIGNRVLNLLVNRLFGTRFTDLSYGCNAFWARHLDALQLQCAGFEVHTLMYIRATKAGLKIQEIPSYQRPRIHGTSNVRVGRDGWQMIKLIFRERFSRKGEPDRPGLPPHGARQQSHSHEHDTKGNVRDLAARPHPQPHRSARAAWDSWERASGGN